MALVGVNDWLRDTWQADPLAFWGYDGTATAGSNYDTLEQLAKDITAKASDAYMLRLTNPGALPVVGGITQVERVAPALALGATAARKRC